MVKKKTQTKYLWRNIRKNSVSFLAVAFIAATSIAVFLGLQSAAAAILEEVNDYFVSNCLATLEISCSGGITQEDLDVIASWDGADVVEGGYATTAVTAGQTEQLVLQVLSLCDEINVPEVIEGTLPSASNEAAVEETYAKNEGVQVGDVLILEHDGCLTTDTFTVTAIIDQPSYCCSEVQDARGLCAEGLGAASYYVEVTAEAFNREYYGGCYTKAYLKNFALDDIFYFSDEYARQEKELIESFEEKALIKGQAENADWILSGREEIGDIRGVQIIVDGIYGVSYAVSLIFMLVAAVVCYSAITRMIGEQRALIGAQKAFGFRPQEILAHYRNYSLLCAALGILLGFALTGIVEFIVLSIFTADFVVGDISMTFAWRYGLLAVGICLAVFLSASHIACKKLVREQATVLLGGELPGKKKPYFFEKWKGYRKLSLYSRTMIRNVLDDKGRLLTTIVGVVGCISLLVVCFSMRLAITESTEIQYDRYFLYDYRLVIDSSAAAAEEFETALDEAGVSWMVLQDKLISFRVDGGDQDLAHMVVVPEIGELSDYMVLEDSATGDTADLPENGILVSAKCAELYDLSAGSTVEVTDAAGNSMCFQVVGVIEHYLAYHMFVTTENCYEAAAGNEADTCVYLLKGDADGLYGQLRDMDGFLSLKDNSEYIDAAKSDEGSVNIMIAVCLILSAVMALLVLLNQIVMHISRKSRELAVMRINGYTLKETRAYVYRDNIVLTAIGFFLGSGLGLLLSYAVVRAIETGALRYVRTPNLLACFYACAVGAVFSLIVNLIALRRIGRLNLTDMNGN